MVRAKELITQDEIYRLKKNPRQLSWKDVVPEKDGFIIPLIPTELESGYLVSYTIDSIYLERPEVKTEHVTISAEMFEPDPVDMDEIAQLILGDCFRTPAEWGAPKNGAHYLQIKGLDEKDMKRFREDGIECGVVFIETRKMKLE